MGKRDGGTEIEIKRCEVGRRKSTSITGQAVVQGTEGFLSNLRLKTPIKTKMKRVQGQCSFKLLLFGVNESLCGSKIKCFFYYLFLKKSFLCCSEQDKETDPPFICMAGARS